MKIDRFLAKLDSMGRTKARSLVLSRSVAVDGVVVERFDLEVSRFNQIEVDGVVFQRPERLLHLMLNKPAGVLSATSDPEHQTVIDLIDDPDKSSLHLVGRLDRSTTGLVILTNDGRWSKRLMDPSNKVPKVYRVGTRDPIPESAIEAFSEGFYFHTEDITTQPAELQILSDHEARLTLFEGRYHQVKRMFHRIGNRVEWLHREKIGAIELPDELGSGQWRPLTEAERSAF